MGRFTLRDQGQTIGIGKVTKLITEESEAADAAAASASAAAARAA
jgi:peptide chain release factor subunit 3